MNSEKKEILVVDDDKSHRFMLQKLISGWGYVVDEADDGSVAVEKVTNTPYDLVLMDIRMLKVSGLEALTRIKSINPSIPVIIMTAYSSVESAVKALKNGAYDYLTKPLDFEKLKFSLERAVEHTRLKEENRLLRESLGERFETGNLIGRSPAMIKLMETVAQIAPTEATVLISGESGSGKELVAGAIHQNSRRKDGPFIKFNCAAITESLIESELFGHVKGAFTGADRNREGRFRQADGGTLFMDEVGEMSLTMQVKLLRALQEREVTPVGGETVARVDVRLIVATNKNLSQEVEKGNFREDLYYRLNVVNLNIPPLRKRKEDIPILARYFADQFAKKNEKNISGFSPKAMDYLIHHDWPGNVRELMNTVERGIVMSRSDVIDLPDIGGEIPEDESCRITEIHSGDYTLEEVEKAAILKTLEETGGNKSEAARRLGITRKTLSQKLKKYGVSG